MFAFPGMLVDAAEKAGMSVPKNPDEYEKNKTAHPHWFVFCLMQLGRSMPYAGVHFDNAKVIASIPKDEIFKITVGEIFAKGFK